LIIKVLY